MEVRLRALHVQAVQASQAFRTIGAFSAIRCTVAVVMTLLWCWAVFRVAAQPARSGPVEQGLAIGGWTLSLLPVHVAPRRPVRRKPAAGGPHTAAAALPTPRTPARGCSFAGAAPVSRRNRA